MSDKNLLAQLIDIKALNELVENFNDLTGLNISITTTDPNKHLIRVGWTDICKKYHQANPGTEEQCRANNISIISKITKPGEILISTCNNGLINACSPIYIDGQLAGYLFSGQVLCAPPDISFFKAQAIEYGFSSKDYIDSLKKVKIADEHQLKTLITLLTNNITLLAEKNQQLKATQAELKQQNKVLQTISELTPIAIGILDKRKIAWTNPAMSAITGYSAEELAGLNTKVLYKNKEDFLNVKEHNEKQYKVKGYSERQIQCIKKNGESFDALATSRPIDSHAPTGSIVFTLMDITELNHSRKLLDESAERLKIITKATKVGLWDWDLKTDNVVTNGPHLKLFDYDTETHHFTVNAWMKFLHPEDIPWAEQHINNIKSGGIDSWEISYRVRAADGKYRWVSGKGTVIEKDEQNKPLRVVGVQQDITAAKNAALEKEGESKKYREIVDHMSSAVFIFKSLGKRKFIVEDLNQAALHIAQNTRANIIGKVYHDIFPGHTDINPVEIFQRVIDTGKPEWSKQRHYKHNNLEIWGDLYIFKLPTEKIVTIYNNNTEAKKAEIELQRQHQELEETNITLRVLVRKYEEEKQIQEKRIATNVQMLVNPYLEKIKNTKLTETQQNYIDILETGLNDLSSPLAVIAAARDFQLSQTETKVANLVRQGHPSKKIADILNISIQTVHKHRATIRKKLGVSNQNVNLITLLNQLD